jgi:hypothetical protein
MPSATTRPSEIARTDSTVQVLVVPLIDGLVELGESCGERCGDVGGGAQLGKCHHLAAGLELAGGKCSSYPARSSWRRSIHRQVDLRRRAGERMADGVVDEIVASDGFIAGRAVSL